MHGDLVALGDALGVGREAAGSMLSCGTGVPVGMAGSAAVAGS
ncbi:hypothetical protein ABTY53_02610 [Streptomyces noursei]